MNCRKLHRIAPLRWIIALSVALLVSITTVTGAFAAPISAAEEKSLRATVIPLQVSWSMNGSYTASVAAEPGQAFAINVNASTTDSAPVNFYYSCNYRRIGDLEWHVLQSQGDRSSFGFQIPADFQTSNVDSDGYEVYVAVVVRYTDGSSGSGVYRDTRRIFVSSAENAFPSDWAGSQYYEPSLFSVPPLPSFDFAYASDVSTAGIVDIIGHGSALLPNELWACVIVVLGCMFFGWWLHR